MLMAIGEAVDVANEMRKARGRARQGLCDFGARVCAMPGSMPVHDEQAARPAPGGGEITVYLSDAAPIASPAWTLHGELGRRAMLRRLWAGG